MKLTEHLTNKEYYLNQRTDCTLNIMGRENDGIPGRDDQV